MTRSPFELLEDPSELARYGGWSEPVYRDLIALQQGRLSSQEFDDRHLVERAILVLDLTGFTETAERGGAVQSFLRILDAQKVCLPVLRETGATFVRTFADDIVALFDDPNAALDAALAIHDRSGICCIGLGWGPVYEIGPNRAMGDEMNRASKLGEDTARAGETLLTEGARKGIDTRPELVFEPQFRDDLLFPYFRVAAR